MLTVLGGLAEFERHLILSRTNEGRVRGVRFGRKPKLTKHQQGEALARLAQGETLTAIAKSYNVSHMTISRLASGLYAIGPDKLCDADHSCWRWTLSSICWRCFRWVQDL